ncbi:MAG TPA: hypothetical protein VFN60_02115 [Acidimicrobiales bacterium]|nr:hypothetical protein [Acidimicrobiales bacterium]
MGGPVASTSLALALAAGPSRAGSWVAAVGVPCLGGRAAAELGVDLDRLVLVPEAGEQWAVVVAALLEVVDVAVLGLPSRGVRAADARRLTARARERGAVLLLLPDPVPVGRGAGSLPGAWPESPELRLGAEAAVWEGLGQGDGHLRARAVTLTALGRRGASRPRSVEVWLPGPDGRVAARTAGQGSRRTPRGAESGAESGAARRLADAVGT